MTTPKSYRPRPGRPKGWRKGAINGSKMFNQRADNTRVLLASIEVFRDQVTKGMSHRLTPELADGEALPDWGLSLELVGRSVVSALDRLRSAEWLHCDWQGRCVTLRRRTERLARDEVYPRVVTVRQVIDAQLGKEIGRTVHGLSGKTRRKARSLQTQLSGMVFALECGDEEASAPLMACVASDRQAWLRDIKPHYEQLTEALERLASLELSEQWARDDKRLAMADFDAAYGEALRLAQAAFAFAGCSDGAIDKLRAYHQRRTLKHRAREVREARAEGRLEKTLRRAATTALEWVGGRPPSAA